MKKYLHIAIVAFTAWCLVSCVKDEIKTYRPEDSAVVFHGRTNTYSFKGMTEDFRDIDVAVDLVGYCADYDRTFAVEVIDSTAVLGRDFTIISSDIKAGAVRGFVKLRVNHLPQGVERQDMKLKIVPNEYFRAGPPKNSIADITWSEEYTRPQPYVWRGWYLYFCHGYSKELHRLMVSYFGEEIETYVVQQAPAKEDPTLTYKLPTWWYSATREFREWVKKTDAENPSNPLRHSDDYEQYRTYTTAHGEGEKPDIIPTIYETLNVL
ncbi:MAG: DUF4843 domain-containing protein [Bacteroidales bacterium]|nr:DUF4843 domain-containing protein [Bacteroidales bacterium]MBR5034099.1 DUF4843 domain-containing protein [Bacteroidales bacterium]